MGCENNNEEGKSEKKRCRRPVSVVFSTAIQRMTNASADPHPNLNYNAKIVHSETQKIGSALQKRVSVEPL